MEARIQKWGNSDGIRITSSILKSLNIKTNDILNIEKLDIVNRHNYSELSLNKTQCYSTSFQ